MHSKGAGGERGRGERGRRDGKYTAGETEEEYTVGLL